MKKLILTLSFSILGLNAFAIPGGNDHGNGGGVICVNNHCQTLADSGLAMSPEYPDFWIPPEEVLKNINFLIDMYPFAHHIRTKIRQQVLLKLTHIKAVDVVDPVKLEVIKNFYMDTIKNVSPNFDFTNFKIVALSSDDSAEEKNTFLLPDFLQLDPLNQAKMLIHEGLYRGRPSSDLKFILQLESALKNFEFPGKLSVVDSRRHMVTSQIAAYNLKILNNSETLAHIVISTYYPYVKSYTYFDYSLDEGGFHRIFDVTIDQGKYFLNVNSDYVQQTSSLDARAAVMLLNLDPVELEKNIEIKNDSYLMIDPLQGFKKFDEIWKNGYVEYFSYTIKDPENLKLLLPK